MTSFSLLVAGPVDWNLAPFHCYEYDGIMDEYVHQIEITDSYVNSFEYTKEQYAAAEMKHNKAAMEFFEWSDFKTFLEKNNNLSIYPEGQVPDGLKKAYGVEYPDGSIKVFRMTNENFLYDYYTIGGTWNGGLLLLKKKDENGEDVYTSQAKKGEIDFEEMWKRKADAARETYRNVVRILGKTPAAQPQSSLLVVFGFGKGSELYRRQPDVELWNSLRDQLADYVPWNARVEEFSMSEDNYVEHQMTHTLTYGLVVDRKYFSHGDEWWWGEMKNPGEVAWDEEYKEAIDALDDEELITVVTCDY